MTSRVLLHSTTLGCALTWKAPVSFKAEIFNESVYLRGIKVQDLEPVQ